MNHGSLFSGGGGFDLAAELMGWNNVFHCEMNPFCQTILKHYWPGATLYDNIKTFNGNPYRGKIDIITGGFPCQPFSTAGKRRGTDDARYLWPEMLRIIREIKPRWVVGENVHGIVSWNEGLVFDKVHADLEAEGYKVRSVILPAAGVNAPHQRNRVWFIAYSADAGELSSGCTSNTKREEKNLRRWEDVWSEFSRQSHQEYAANAHKKRQQLAPAIGELERERLGMPGTGNYWEDWPTQSALCGGNDGLPSGLDGIALSKWSKESIKVFGNAIVPQVAYELFSVIEAMSAA